MPQIINAFRGQSPIAKTIADLGTAMFGDRTSGELNREKLYAAQRSNVETDNLMDRTAKMGADKAVVDPVAQAMMLGAGYKPADYNDMALMSGATKYGAQAPQTQDLQVGSGQAYNNTYGAFSADQARREREAEATLAEDRRQFDMTPEQAIVNDQPVFLPRAGVFDDGVAPVLSDSEVKGTRANANFGNFGDLPIEEQTYIGADPSANKPGTTWNYIGPDGQSYLTNDALAGQGLDVQGNPLPPGGYRGTVEGTAGDVGLTNSVLTDSQSKVIANKKFLTTATMAKELTKDPSLFGPGGMVRSAAQDLVQSIGGIPALQEAKMRLESELGGEKTAALVPEFYDPNLSEVQTLWGVLLYQGAAALAGQEGRSISDKDVAMMRHILGDPHSLFASNISMSTKIDTAMRLIGAFDAIDREALGGRGPVAGDPNVQPGAAPPGQTAPAQEEVWERDASGVLRRVQ